jgi:hypothetical protein
MKTIGAALNLNYSRYAGNTPLYGQMEVTNGVVNADGALSAGGYIILNSSFRPAPQPTPNMTVALAKGTLQLGTSLTSVAGQNTGTIVAPATNPRNDIVYIDATTGVVGVATGTEAVSPSDPAVPTGKIAVARIRLTVGVTSIVYTMMDDIRPISGISGGNGVGYPRRQTVPFGPTDANGAADWGGSTGGTTLTASGTFVVIAANGFDSLSRPVDNIGVITNPQWTGLNSNGIKVLYIDVDANGVCTPGFITAGTSLLETTNYIWDGSIPVTSGQYTFNISEMKGYMGNGVSAPQVTRVFVGMVTVSGGVVSAIHWFAYNRVFSGARSTPLPGTASVSGGQTHYLGVNFIRNVNFILTCISDDGVFLAGNSMMNPATRPIATAIGTPIVHLTTAINAYHYTGANASYCAISSAGTLVNLDVTKWNYRYEVDAGW